MGTGRPADGRTGGHTHLDTTATHASVIMYRAIHIMSPNANSSMATFISITWRRGRGPGGRGQGLQEVGRRGAAEERRGSVNTHRPDRSKRVETRTGLGLGSWQVKYKL